MRRPRQALPAGLTASVLALGGVAWAAAARPVTGFHGGSSAVTVASLVPRLDKAEDYTEAWQFCAWLDGGWTAQVWFLATNLGPGDGGAAITIRVTSPDGKVVRAHEDFDRGEWIFAHDAFSLKLGDSVVGGGPTTFLVKAVGAGVRFDLEFKNAIAGWAPRGGDVLFGVKPDKPDKNDGLYHLDVVAPRASVRGRLWLGGSAVSVTGTGYADHSRSTIVSHKMARSWDRFRGYTPTHSVVLLRFLTPTKYGSASVGWLMAAVGPKVVFTDFAYELVRGDLRPDATTTYGYKPPWAWTLKASNAKGRLEGTIRATDMLAVNDFLKEFGALERLVLKGFAKPVMYDQRCEFDFVLETKGSSPERIAGKTDGCGSTVLNK